MAPAHRILLLPIVGAIAAAGQSLTPTQRAELARAAKNPFELAKFIDTHPAPGWQFDVKPATHRFAVAPDYRQRGFEACKTKLLPVKTPEQSIVVIECAFIKDFVRYTHQPDGSWQAEGTAGIGPRAPTQYQLDQTSGTPFLRLTSEWDHGSDVYEVGEEWYDLTRPGLNRSFALITEGWEDRRLTGIGRKFSTSVAERNNQVRATLHIQFFTNHEVAIDSLSPAFLYTRAQPSEPFRCRSLDPIVTCKDLDKLTATSENETPTEEYLIHFALPGLKKITAGPDGETKRWLREYIAARKDTPEVRQIRALLQ